jgi:pyruvate kinase
MKAAKTLRTQHLSVEKDLLEILRQLIDLQCNLIESWASVRERFSDLDPWAQSSARNLVHYIALRRHDLRRLQDDLARYGFSSLGRSEASVMNNINRILNSLYNILQRPAPAATLSDLSFDEGKRILTERTNKLLGTESAHRRVRIMVTLPREAANNYGLVRDLIENGMNVARINCAHDSPQEWEQMVDNIRRVSREIGRECKICLDIAGPKLRTGPLEDGPGVLKLRPQKDIFGRVTKPVKIWLTSLENPEPSVSAADARLALPKEFLRGLRPGDKIEFSDTREAKRSLRIVEKCRKGYWGECAKTAYISPETEFKVTGQDRNRKARAGNIPLLEQFIPLKKGDQLILTKDDVPGRNAKIEVNGERVEPARISCTIGQVFDDVKAGEKIFFDDGKLAGVIKTVQTNEILVEIRNSGVASQKLRADKGINLPDSDLRFPSLTAKDLVDLEFVVRHADLIGYSFVRDAGDVLALQEKLQALKGDHLGMVLKIETRRAFEQLPEILLTAMHSASVGVMIARGDLAIETGFERLAEVQEEILWMCEAAHIPVIWATQVLEGLSKTGVYSRAEITDAAMSERAECVMLNKGDFIVEAVKTLDNVLTRMQAHQDKKRAMFRHLRVADNFFAEKKLT